MPPYATWEQVAEAVLGEDRLKDMLLPKRETADLHPFFDRQLAVAQRELDVALEQAGFEVPLAGPLTDPFLLHIVIGLLVGHLTETSSSREGVFTDLHNAALADLKRLAKGGMSLIGVDVDETPSTISMLGTGGPSGAIFDTDDPYAETYGVFAQLGRGPGGWRR